MPPPFNQDDYRRLTVLETKMEQHARVFEEIARHMEKQDDHLAEQDASRNRLMGAVMIIAFLAPFLAQLASKVLFK